MLAILVSLFRRPTPARTARRTDDPFAELFHRHHRQVVAFFVRRGCSPPEPQDLAQETFLRAYAKRRSYRGDSNELTWLLAIATNLWRNRCRDLHAAKRSAVVVSLDASIDGSSDDRPPPLPTTEGRQEHDAVEHERLRRLASAIDDLTPAMRRCVKLRVYQDKSFRDIAAILGIEETTAKSQMSRARKLLRGMLADHYPELGSDSEHD